MSVIIHRAAKERNNSWEKLLISFDIWYYKCVPSYAGELFLILHLSVFSSSVLEFKHQNWRGTNFNLLFFLILLSSFRYALFCIVFLFPTNLVFISFLYPSFSLTQYLASKTQTLAPLIFLFSSSFPLWWRPILFSNQHFEKKSQQISSLYRDFLKRDHFHCNSKYAPADATTLLKVIKCSLYILPS